VSARVGSYTTLLASLALLVTGLLLMLRTSVGGSYLTDVAPAMAVIGLGAGLGFPALTTLAMSGATPADSGLASGLVNTTVQVGGAVGLAVLATLSSGRSETLREQGRSVAQALNGGYHLAYLIAAGAALLALVVAAVTLRPAGGEFAEPVAIDAVGEPEAEPIAA
jgi:MFS family permease